MSVVPEAVLMAGRLCAPHLELQARASAHRCLNAEARRAQRYAQDLEMQKRIKNAL